MPIPQNPPTHAEQQQLRKIKLDAEQYIAKGLHRFEELTGVSVNSIELVRWPNGAYGPTLRLGPATGDSRLSSAPDPSRFER